MIGKRYYKKPGGFSYLLRELKKKLGKELATTFCLSDNRVYGNLCGIAFERQGTIGRGNDRCDFYFYRK